MKAKECPKGCGTMELLPINQLATVRGVELQVSVKQHICRVCGFASTDLAATGEVQQQIAEGYREKKGLLTGKEIKALRKAKGLTQDELATVMGVGIASIKRWEKANIQSESMDKLLRAYLQGDCREDVYTGNREFVLPRVKLVIRHFESALGRQLIKDADKFLFVSKYLWYADMLAFRKLGRSMTGATYAALPYGPQLNNYSALIDEIKTSDASEAEPLSTEEARIIEWVAGEFPEDRMVYDAAHRERIWKVY
jgi:putative zinc finger/helix-turn-helix YgiT family protein